MMRSIVPCFIRHNNKYLRDSLDKLGYVTPKHFDLEGECLITGGGGYTTIYERYYIRDHWNISKRVDCGHDEEIFLTLVSLGYNLKPKD